MNSMSVRLLLLLMAVAPAASPNRPAAVQAQDPPTVSFWKRSQAFSKGPMLLDRMDASRYQVYAVRRDKPGTVELHALDTDLIFVLDGMATFVTGGSIADPRELRVNESTGSAIRDGTPRQVAKGDVVIVPNRTPHWFKEVSPTISYFAMKVRQPNPETRAPSSVQHWKASDAFIKGGLLFDAREGQHFRVYAIRRDKPLAVELHEADTDVVFVLNGTGTFLTGGTIVDKRTLRENESTGSDIRGGDPRPLDAGDVLVVPAGTPHWLSTVNGTIDFYAVKVR